MGKLALAPEQRINLMVGQELMSTEQKSSGEWRTVSRLTPAGADEVSRFSRRKLPVARSIFQAVTAAAVTLFVSSLLWAGDGQYTQRAGVSRTGTYDSEIYLTPENVNSTLFGSLYSYPVDGTVAAQPLYVPGVTIPGVGTVNVLYVATQHDSVFAFNADTPGSGSPLWQASFRNTANGVNSVPISAQGCAGVTAYTEIGVMGTPVIDPTTNTMYVVAKTQEAAGSSYNYVFRLHALDITTGAEKFGGPTVITASVMNGKTQVNLNTQDDQQRPALLEANGSIFIGFGSNGCDKNAHGWLLAYNTTTLQQQAVFNTSPAVTYGSSLWMSGVGPAADAENSIYLISANGSYDINTGGSDWGDTMLRMTFDGSKFTVADSFTPFNQATMASEDLDLGSGGAVLLPPQTSGPPNLLVAAGKTGTIYLVNTANMGGYNSSADNIVQELPGAVTSLYGAPVYWNNALYFAGRNDMIKAFPFVNGVIVTPPVTSANSYLLTGVPVISANGSSNGVFWLVRNLTPTSSTTMLSAFNASTLQTNLVEIYDTQQNSTRDALGTAPHFVTPLIVNGKVYVGTNTAVKVYGLFPNLAATAGNSQSGTVNTAIKLTAQASSPYTGAGIPNITVAFSDGGRGGVFSPATVVTDVNGNAATTYTLPKTSGAVSITATSSGYTTATFAETAVAGPPASIATVSGYSQSGTVGTTLPAPLIAKVKDSYGNIVINAQVTFADAGLNGSFSPNPVTTGTNGEGSTNFTLPTTAKTNLSATASSGTATAAVFHETSVAGAPSTITILAGNKQTGTHGTQLARALQVTVKDEYGNGVPNLTVTFSDNGAGGTFSTSSPVTNSSGVAGAYYTLPGAPGTWTITATVGSLKVSFTEIGN